MHAESAAVAPQFNDAAQQRDAATLGMWIFLATEVLFFGGMLLAYTVYRIAYPAAFHEASNHTLVAVGATNTAVLLTSSYLMALGVHAAEHGGRRRSALFLGVTAALGAAFLVIKGFEYYHEISEGLFPGAGFHMSGADQTHARLFFYLYFLLTGVHALHVLIGVTMLAIFAIRLWLSSDIASLSTSVDLLGLYWHFVDIIWVFLFPLIYLVGRSG